MDILEFLWTASFTWCNVSSIVNRRLRPETSFRAFNLDIFSNFCAKLIIIQVFERQSWALNCNFSAPSRQFSHKKTFSQKTLFVLSLWCHLHNWRSRIKFTALVYACEPNSEQIFSGENRSSTIIISRRPCRPQSLMPLQLWGLGTIVWS